MRTLSASIALATALVALGGCANMAQNRGLESVHQPVVSRTNYALDLYAGGGDLHAGEQAKLAQWFEAMDLGYGDRVALDANGEGSSPVVRAMVEAMASRYGVTVSTYAPVTVGEIAPGTARVVVTRSSARVPGCPNWDDTLEMNYNNATSNNYGCSVNANLAAMVADPEDLVRGQPGAETNDATGSNKAIKTYREAKPTGADGLKQTSTQSGGGQ